MSLAHAILGFLQWEPMTGYDLKVNCFDNSVAHFWNADQAQIYRTLETLAKQGFVESEIEFQQDRPNRKIYKLMPPGREELARWLKTKQPIPIHREAFLIQLFFGGQLSDDEIAALVRDQIVQHKSLLEKYQDIPLPPIDSPDLSRSLKFQRLTLDLGLKKEHMYLEWLENILRILGKA